MKLIKLIESVTPEDFNSIDWNKLAKAINHELKSNLKLEFELNGSNIKLECSNLYSQLGMLSMFKTAKLELEEVSFDGKYKFLATLKLRLSLNRMVIHLGTLMVDNNGYNFITSS